MRNVILSISKLNGKRKLFEEVFPLWKKGCVTFTSSVPPFHKEFLLNLGDGDYTKGLTIVLERFKDLAPHIYARSSSEVLRMLINLAILEDRLGIIVEKRKKIDEVMDLFSFIFRDKLRDLEESIWKDGSKARLKALNKVREIRDIIPPVSEI